MRRGEEGEGVCRLTSMPISTGLTLGTVAMIQTNTDGDKRGREAGEERGMKRRGGGREE